MKLLLGQFREFPPLIVNPVLQLGSPFQNRSDQVILLLVKPHCSWDKDKLPYHGPAGTINLISHCAPRKPVLQPCWPSLILEYHHLRALAHAVLTAMNVLFSSFYLVNSYSSFSSQVKCHFLREALPDYIRFLCHMLSQTCVPLFRTLASGSNYTSICIMTDLCLPPWGKVPTLNCFLLYPNSEHSAWQILLMTR